MHVCFLHNSQTSLYAKDGSLTFSEVLESSHPNTTLYDTPQVMSSEVYYLEVYLPYCILRVNFIILCQMFVIWNSSLPYIPSRHDYTCLESTRPPAPSIVENITIASCLVNDSVIALYIEWLPPSTVNGELSSYDIWIGRMLGPQENSLNMDLIYITVPVCKTPYYL